MVKDEVTRLNALMIATVVLMLAGHGLPVISVHFSGFRLDAACQAAACSESDDNACMLGP